MNGVLDHYVSVSGNLLILKLIILCRICLNILAIFHLPLAKLDGIINRKAKGEPTSPMLPDSDDEDDPYGEKEADMRLGKKRVRRRIYDLGKYNECAFFSNLSYH